MKNFSLNKEELNFFHENGFIGPFVRISPQEMNDICREISKNLEKIRPYIPLKDRFFIPRNRHLDWPLIAQLCFHSSIIDRVSSIIGSNLILWRTQFFFARQGRGITWHRDEYNTLLSESRNHLSVHLAVNKATEENCLSLLPGSHKLSSEELQNKYGLLMSKQGGLGVPRSFCEGENLGTLHKMLLSPGEFFIFHPSLLHTSKSLSKKKTKKIFSFGKKVLSVCRTSIGLTPLPESLRIGLGLRIASTNVRILPAAFSEYKYRNDKCVILSGTNEPHLNEIGDWFF